MSRDAVVQAKRVVIKIGSSTLTGSAGHELDETAVKNIVDVVASLRDLGKEVVLVSSGAIAAGLSPLKLSTRPTDLVTQQAVASVGQGLLIASYSRAFATHKLIASQVLLTIEDVERESHSENAKHTLNKLLEMGVVPIINENDSVGVQEIRMGDNDRLSAFVAGLIEADLLALVTDVDGLYNVPPHEPGSTRISEVQDASHLGDIEIGGVGTSGVGSGGMVTKIEAAKIATDSGITMLLTSLPNLAQTLKGEDLGTIFHAKH